MPLYEYKIPRVEEIILAWFAVLRYEAHLLYLLYHSAYNIYFCFFTTQCYCNNMGYKRVTYVYTFS